MRLATSAGAAGLLLISDQHYEKRDDEEVGAVEACLFEVFVPA